MEGLQNRKFFHPIASPMAGAKLETFARITPEMASITNGGYAPEGAKRRYPAHFVSKLTDSDGELQETRHWLSRALAYGYITEQISKGLEERCDRIGGMLGKMVQNPDNFT